jgi:hypothetical protein
MIDKSNTLNKDNMIQTKVSPDALAKLKWIENKYGFRTFQLLRMLADCIIRFMDDETNLSEDLTRIIRMFDDVKGWGRSICLASDDDEWVIDEAVYIIRAKGKSGLRMVKVSRPQWHDTDDGKKFDGTSTYNVQHIVERVIEVANPSLYKHLRQIAVEDFGTESIMDTLHMLVGMHKENPDEKELRQQFEDNDWEHGAKVHDPQRIKRHHAKSMDYYEKQQTLFDKEEEQ